MDMPDDTDPRKALLWYWRRLAEIEASVENKLNTRFPVQVRLFGKFVQWVYDLCVSPAFAIMVSFLLVPLVISEAISLITWGCVAAAWLIAVFGLARQPRIKSLSIAKRVALVLGGAVLMAFLGSQYIGWSLQSHYRNHPTPIIANATVRAGTDDLAVQRLRELFDEEIAKAQARSPSKVIHEPTPQQLAEMLRKAFPVQPSEKKPCHPENGNFDDCTDVEVLDWGQPVLERLNDAVQKGIKSMYQRHERYMQDHDERALNDKTVENADLCRSLENDYKNLKTYRALLLSKLKGGDPTSYDPINALTTPPYGVLWGGGRIGLAHADPFRLTEAEEILRDLQDLSNRLRRQVVLASK